MEKIYLGDGAYVEPDLDPQSLKLTTSDGISNTNTVVLDIYALEKLSLYIEEWSKEQGFL